MQINVQITFWQNDDFHQKYTNFIKIIKIVKMMILCERCNSHNCHLHVCKYHREVPGLAQVYDRWQLCAQWCQLRTIVCFWAFCVKSSIFVKIINFFVKIHIFVIFTQKSSKTHILYKNTSFYTNYDICNNRHNP